MGLGLIDDGGNERKSVMMAEQDCSVTAVMTFSRSFSHRKRKVEGTTYFSFLIKKEAASF